MSVDRASLRYAIINVPLTDPTTAYHSIPYLVGYAKSKGFVSQHCIDANIDALNYMAQPSQIEPILRDAADLITSLERKRHLSRREELQYRFALKATGFRSDAVMLSLAILRGEQFFYDYGQYRIAVITIKRWLDLLSLKGYPGQFEGLALRRNGYGNLDSVRDLTNEEFLDCLIEPLVPYFEGPFSETLYELQPHVIGISVNYLSQLPYAIWLTRFVRQRLSTSIICLGGTEITDVAKYLARRQDFWKLFSCADFAL